MGDLASAIEPCCVSHSSKPQQQPEGEARFWYRDNFFLTTSKAWLDPRAINRVFASDLMWWNDPLEETQMSKMLTNCLTVSVYWVPETEAQMKNGNDLELVGLARVITDYVTFAYLTDVFITRDFQRRGLASWMMRGVKEVVSEWPNLRGLVLMTSDKAAAKMYQRELGALEWDEGPSAGLVLLEMPGRGVKDVPEDHD
ncbi:hypothetical protein ESCO_003750 [Escovopsis weberi]|uniref:N-acetyltransferase domain-containing protein n=1 Tax=Escovopsis weberi TaxID=150374 RepID=A0A0M8N0G8_ESCWE|nr:hypothetical protein ESCO_003750 [Escovopsis weberi]